MLKWTGTNGVQVGCDWFSTGCTFTSLYLDEVIGGRFPFGRIKLISSGSGAFLDKVLNSSDINITLGDEKKGTVLDIHGVITNREFFDACATIEFESLPNADFFRKRIMKTWKLPILKTIEALWGRKIDRRPEAVTDIGTDPPDGNDGFKGFIQASEPNSELLGTLLGSYMNKFVYAIGLDNLLMKGLIGTDSTGHQEPYWTITSKGDTMTPAHDGPGTEEYRLNYDRRLYLEDEDAWDLLEQPKAEDIRSKYWELKEFDNTLRIVSKETSYWKMRKNLINNQKIYDSVMYNQMTLMKNDFIAPTYRLGDVVKYLRPGISETKVPWEIYIISGIKYYVNAEPDRESGRGADNCPFKQIYTLHCLQEKGATLPCVGADPLT